MNIKPIHEYLLWNNCSNHCDFCIQATQNRLKKEEQLDSIRLVKTEILSLVDSHVLIMGGEIFDIIDKDIQNALAELFLTIHQKMVQNEIELLYLNTNLLYDVSYLKNVLDIFKDMIGRLRFTTSDDFDGRFKGKSKTRFYKNLIDIRNTYPDLRIVSNTILTKPFCEAVLDGRYSLARYMEMTGCLVNTIPYIKVVNDDLAPEKELVIKTLKRLDEEVTGYSKEFCDDFLLNQPRMLSKYQSKKLVDVTAEDANCGHCINFRKCFSDTDECFVCLLKTLSEADFFY